MFNNFFSPEIRVVNEKRWKNTVGPGRPLLTIRCMHIGCWIPKATDTLRIYNNYSFSAATMIARTRLNVTLYAYCLLVLQIVQSVDLSTYRLRCRGSLVTQQCLKKNMIE